MDETNIVTTQVCDIQYQIKKIDAWQMFIIAMCVVLVIIYIAWVVNNQLSKKELEEMSDIMENFHVDPDYDDFIYIWNARDKLIKQCGRPVKFWLYGVYLTQPQFYDETKIVIVRSWIREIERTVRRAGRNPTAESMDCIWSLYFATGDNIYAQIIRRIAVDHPNTLIKNAARLSYRSVMRRDWTENDVEQTAQTNTQNVDDQRIEQPLMAE